ncbi:hypothetical protein N0B16_10150 [Chryseobacterium sp. GMJ5]|uniref:EpsG family protein n=1 Tax=Chryseobacterium gilvum TaxID=2976534 RepID=A0ABT2VXR9_9FLAO|nr:hypothetical protein [Chryseobacterium gilvum]MCU7614797.1 hypothetical protein [Chryseobacterium gilvum]
MRDEKLTGVLFVIVFPFLLFFISYYGFESSYVELKSMEKAPDFMFTSVYAYRVIPNFLMLHVTDAVEMIIDQYLFSFKNFILKNGTVFYHSVFLINAFFFILSSIIINKILKLRPVEMLSHPDIQKVIHLVAIFFIVIIQYVPTNCDCIAVFFYVTGVFLTLRYFHYRKITDFILLCLVVFVSTLVRETACLNIAFFAAVFIDPEEIKKKNFHGIREIIFLILSFILPYLGLKMMITQNASFFEGVYLVKNFTSPFNLAGLLFGILGMYFTFSLCNKNGQLILKRYLFFSLPYLMMITFVGLFWETRLFIPLILSGIVVASHQFKNISTAS